MLYKVFIILLLLFSAPLLLVISAVIYFSYGAPIIFYQKRVGKDGRLFDIYKFRTMSVDSEHRKKSLLRYNEADGPVFKIQNDPRFTKVGKFLAHTGMDELPQLWNVLMGDMALIGPRPLPVAEAEKLVSWQKKRHSIKPGIISPWILEGYHTMSFDAWMKSDIAYTKDKSFLNDVSLGAKACRFLILLFIRECKKLTQNL